MSAPQMPAPVAAAFATWPSLVAGTHRDIRALIFKTADADPATGPLTETLKWGEPAYLTETTRSGSTIRLGVLRDAPERAAVFFNCRTILLDTFRSRFPHLETRGDRALLLPKGPLSEAHLAICLRLALTYHRWRKAA